MARNNSTREILKMRTILRRVFKNGKLTPEQKEKIKTLRVTNEKDLSVGLSRLGFI